MTEYAGNFEESLGSTNNGHGQDLARSLKKRFRLERCDLGLGLRTYTKHEGSDKCLKYCPEDPPENARIKGKYPNYFKLCAFFYVALFLGL